MAGQVNARLLGEDDVQFSQWATELGIERGLLARKILMEGLAAKREGRAMFEQPETISPADLQRLIGEVNSTRVELDRQFRYYAERDAALVKSAKQDTVGISEARTSIVSQVTVALDRKLQQVIDAIVTLSRKIDNPPTVAALHEDLKSLRAEIGSIRESDLIAAKDRQAEIIRETRKRRALFMLVIDEKHWSTALLMTWGLITAIAGALLAIPAASIFPSLAVPMATRLLHNDGDVCQILDRRYAVTDCTVPGNHTKAGGVKTSPTLTKPVRRGKRR